MLSSISATFPLILRFESDWMVGSAPVDTHTREDWKSPATVTAVLATGVWLFAGAEIAKSVDGQQSTGTGPWIAAGALILVVYYWQHRIVALTPSDRSLRGKLFASLLVVLLPYVYGFTGFVEDEFRRPVSKWVGDPLWIYLVPTIFFLIRDFRRTETTVATVGRYGLELLIVVPLWTYCWFVLQMLLGWWTMEP